MNGFIDGIFEAIVITFLCFALLPFYFFCLACLRASPESRKTFHGYFADILLVIGSFVLYIFLIHLLVKQFF